MLASTCIITSRANARVARVRALRRRVERERTGLFLAEGTRLITEAARQGADIRELIAAPDLLRSEVARETTESLERAGVQTLRVTPEVFESLSPRDGPQGVLAVVKQHWTTLAQARSSDGLCWVALAEAQDPGNVGCVIRTADAVGAAGVILLGSTADPYDPAAVRASTGAVFAQRLVRATPRELSDWKRAHGVTVVGTSGSAKADYRSGGYEWPLVVLMGSEQHGLSPEQLALCDRLVGIPMIGSSDSLNLAVATAVVLYEVLRQREGTAGFRSAAGSYSGR